MAKPKKLFRTVLIDPFNQTITEQTVEHDLDAYYRLLNVELIEAVYTDDEGGSILPDRFDALYVDEEGLLKSDARFFEISGKVLAGRAMTIGVTSSGKDAEAKATLEEVKAAVKFRPELRANT